MKVKKIPLLYLFSLIPAFLLIIILLTQMYDVSTLNNTHSLTPEGAKILGQKYTETIRELLKNLLTYYALLIVLTAVFLIWRFFKTTKNWISETLGIVLAIFSGMILTSYAFAIAYFIAQLLHWNLSL